MYRILIVEDDMGIAEAIKEQAKLWELEAKCVQNFRNVLKDFADYEPHLILMDISLPFFNGYHWCQEIRKASKVPIIFISSASDNMNIVMAMNMGADDFISKPFDQSVLIAKIQALLRRAYDFGETLPILEHHGAMLNTGDNTLVYQDQVISLTKNEYRILFTLMKNKGKVVSREKLMEQLWETDSFVDDNTLTVNITRLRKKLESAGLTQFVTTKFGIGYLLFDFQKALRKHKKLQKLQEMTAAVMEDFPEAVTQDDIDYQQLIQQLREEQRQLENQMSIRYADMVEYYTIWAHQIKTPIASMRLHLQNEDSSFSRRLSDDLFRIEQYVEMVLMFLRLDSASTDYVIQEYDLDRIVKQAVKKYASQFINKKIQLRYHPLNTTVLTDEKWLLFVLEQVLSNALKYTPSGSVAIDLESPKTLCIRDTGIGIAPEDLPRIFEKGYTGYNGRSDKKASGIGLYLCRRICRNLGHTITANSSLESGTVIRIQLERKKVEFE